MCVNKLLYDGARIYDYGGNDIVYVPVASSTIRLPTQFVDAPKSKASTPGYIA